MQLLRSISNSNTLAHFEYRSFIYFGFNHNDSCLFYSDNSFFKFCITDPFVHLYTNTIEQLPIETIKYFSINIFDNDIIEFFS